MPRSSACGHILGLYPECSQLKKSDVGAILHDVKCYGHPVYEVWIPRQFLPQSQFIRGDLAYYHHICSGCHTVMMHHPITDPAK